MILAPYIQLLNQPLAFWAGNCDENNMPDIVHCNGIIPVEDGNQITFFISEKYSQTFLDNLKLTRELTFTGTSVTTLEGYQYKGTFESIRPCTPEEVQKQMDYLEKFTDIIELVGFSRGWYYDCYFHQPSVAITMSVYDIFEQTPKKGTGMSMVNK